ncbi:tRNA (guanosine(46)-N7)-methyltransferase TrmB [Dermabacteraceae bacterium TAE3-ERU5]|nr:tRNA (guanosine(46)-N7)-methyltransferase TrmB [Dermabacteraceae bacterium TAE3-ERU5]
MPNQESSTRRRAVVSFVRRGSRLTRSRQDAWDRLSERYVLQVPSGVRETAAHPDARLNPAEIFGREAPLTVEIGSGLGENVANAAAQHPERDFLAFEVYRPGIAQTLDRLERLGLPPNVRLVELDAQHSLPVLLPAGSLSEVWIFMPDPWHKTRHHKRRIVQPEFASELSRLLIPGGTLRLSTDWAAYAEHMRSVLDNHADFQNAHPEGPRPAGTAADPVSEEMPLTGWAPRFSGRVLTSFERKGREAGRLVWDMTYLRKTVSDV